MYYPKQIPQLLNQTFKKFLNYEEFHFEELSDFILCIWHISSKETLHEPVLNTVLPDGCIDLIFDLNAEVIVFSGFSRNTEKMNVKGNVNFLGVRFKPGAFYELFNVSCDKVMDHTLLLQEIELENDIEAIFNENDLEVQLKIIKEYLIVKIVCVTDISYITYVDQLFDTPTMQCVSEIADELGYQNRQLQRIFTKHYGVTSRVLLNILRLHKCLSLLFDNTQTLSNIAQNSGFFDQAHFIKEIKRYTGIVPTDLIEEYHQ